MTTLTSSANPAVPGQSVTFTAIIAAVAPGGGTPTGSVTFTSNGTTLGPVTYSVVGGSCRRLLRPRTRPPVRRPSRPPTESER